MSDLNGFLIAIIVILGVCMFLLILQVKYDAKHILKLSKKAETSKPQELPKS